MKRRFTRRQRLALYLVADGRCEICGGELEPGWHSDHMVAAARGGPTTLANGQATCPACNQRKGAGPDD